ncbi:MAG: hypothetical protein KIT58_12115, partial [Planctomycetota bacterium]|nr:hypothetical protein [Planctomycetota bacterium]
MQRHHPTWPGLRPDRCAATWREELERAASDFLREAEAAADELLPRARRGPRAWLDRLLGRRG